MVNITSSCVASAPITKTLTYIFVACYIVVIFVAILGNILQILTIVKNKSMFTVTNLLVCNTAVADLLITFIPTTYEVLDILKYNGSWHLGPFMCVFLYMCVYLSVAASIITLMLITIDRFFAIMFPYVKYLRVDMLIYLVPLIWFISFLFAMPTTFVQKVISFEPYKPVCVETWPKPFDEENSPKHYTVVLFVFLYITPLLLMSVLYAMMANKLQKRLSLFKKSKCAGRTPSNENPSNGRSSNEKSLIADKKKLSTIKTVHRRTRVIYMMATITIAFAVCWFPVFFIQFLITFHQPFIDCPESLPHWLFPVSFLLEYSNSAYNPLIYFYFSKTYRNGLIKLVMGFLRRKNDSIISKKTRLSHSSIQGKKKEAATDCLIRETAKL